MKRFLSIITAIAMLFTLAIPSFAMSKEEWQKLWEVTILLLFYSAISFVLLYNNIGDINVRKNFYRTRTE